MTVFHFAYDLMFFGLQEPGYTTQLHWAALAKAVAISFLFATGASLYLAHAHAFHWTRWARRLALIVLGALAITAATWIATPQSLIFFGILHLIAFAGIAGLAFVRGPWWLTVAAALAILAINETVQTELLDARIWQWTGLSVARPNSGDYFPVFPWLAAVLFGIGAARWAHGAGGAAPAGGLPDGRPRRAVRPLPRPQQPRLLPAAPARHDGPALDVAAGDEPLRAGAGRRAVAAPDRR